MIRLWFVLIPLLLVSPLHAADIPVAPLYAGGAPYLEGKYSDIANAISCIYTFALPPIGLPWLQGWVNAQTKLRKLLQDRTLDSERLSEAIELTVKGIALSKNDVETDRLFCLAFLEERDRERYLKRK